MSEKDKHCNNCKNLKKKESRSGFFETILYLYDCIVHKFAGVSTHNKDLISINRADSCKDYKKH